MNNDYLKKEFVGKHIVDLFDFLESLDSSYQWEGGVVTDGLGIEYSRFSHEFVIFNEKNLHSVVLAKCLKNYKPNRSFSVNLTDDFLDYDLIIENVGSVNYNQGDLYQLAKEVNSYATRTRIY